MLRVSPTLIFFLAAMAIGWPGAVVAEPGSNKTFDDVVAPFVKTHCVACHGSAEAEANFALHAVTGKLDAPGELERWEKVFEMLSLRLMPPAEEQQPKRAQREAVLQWIESKLAKAGRAPDPRRLLSPRFGNRTPHDALFSGEHQGPAFSYSRLWRISPDIYAQMATDKGIRRNPNSGLADALAEALASVEGEGFRDFDLLIADEATLRMLVTGSRTLADRMTRGKVISGNRVKKPRVDRNNRVFRDLAMLDAETASDDELKLALNRAFEELLHRSPNADERERYGKFLRRSVDVGGPMLGFQNLLMALLMSPEFIFRMELGLGEKLPDGRRKLAPQELAFALAYALGDRPPDKGLREAVREGRLSTRADVERELRRMFAQYDDVHTYFTVPVQRDGTKSDPYHVRPLRFFREFFGYDKAVDVFKDMEHSRGRGHDPKTLVDDADRFVLEILDGDRDVFQRLLTSDRYFAAYVPPRFIDREMKRLQSKKRNKDQQVQARLARGERPAPTRFRGYLQAYNLDHREWDWVVEQPFSIEHRRGMLTHPAWLVAHSGNFDTDPIRRGKWIREHLLAGNVPDLPIGVDAQLPEDPHRTLRERMQKTRAGECWRCHRHMNPLGLPFEQYDDFGAYREKIVLVKEQRKRNKVVVEEVARPVDARGVLSGTGDEALDGDVDGATQLIDRLARSPRVRQSIIRHVFRFWMGRNEMLSDSPTFMAMDRAYLQSDGSFQELLIALLTSDSFLYRRDRPLVAEAAPRAKP